MQQQQQIKAGKGIKNIKKKQKTMAARAQSSAYHVLCQAQRLAVPLDLCLQCVYGTPQVIALAVKRGSRR